MISTQNLKYVNAASPVVRDDASVTAIAVDTAGFNSAAFVLSIGATDAAVTAFSLTESDTEGGSYTAIANSTPSSLLSATDDNDLNIIHLNLRDKNIKRYIKVVVTVANGTTGGVVSCLAVLGDPAIGPNSAVDRGLNAAGYEVFR
jgi:hypothetical protein